MTILSKNRSVKFAMYAIRKAEAKKRNVEITSSEACQLLNLESIPGWFFHESGRLILCGSRSHDLEPDQFTKLDPNEILDAVRKGLGFWNRPTC